MAVPVKFLKSAEAEFLSLPRPVQDSIEEKIKLLAEFPSMGRAMERAYQGYRCLLAFRNQYRIIYRITEKKTILVAYIRHCRRQLGLRSVH